MINAFAHRLLSYSKGTFLLLLVALVGCAVNDGPPDIFPGTAITTTATAACGNAKVEPGEECDDGNLVNEDACTARCKIAVCGDGIVATEIVESPEATGPKKEECDDSNKNDGDDCNSLCQYPDLGMGLEVEEGEEESEE